MKRIILGCAAVLAMGCALTVQAVEITADEACQAVVCWREMSEAVKGEVAEARTLVDRETEARMNLVTLDGGGFVVTSADDAIEPIIVFSDTGKFEPQDGDPLWDLLRYDLADRQRAVAEKGKLSSRASSSGLKTAVPTVPNRHPEWGRLLGTDITRRPVKLAGNTMKISVYESCIYPLTRTQWSQGNVGGEPCFNLFTPAQTPEGDVVLAQDTRLFADDAEENEGEHAPCGCVATAGAQLMRYYAYPKTSVSSRSFSCKAFGQSVSLKMFGGKYAWSDMPNSPSDNLSDAKREILGKLAYDVGVACRSSYTLKETGAAVAELASALKSPFGYSQAVYFDYGGRISNTADNLNRIIIPNLAAGQPLVMGMRSSSSGHAVLIDGFGYDKSYESYATPTKKLYIHLNMGWGGSYSAWYRPPQSSDALVAGDHSYSQINGFIGNIRSSGSGSLLAGRVYLPDSTTGNEYVIHGAAVYVTGATSSGSSVSKETMTDGNGYYHFVLSPGSYTVQARSSVSGSVQSGQIPVSVGSCSEGSVGNVICDISLDGASRARDPVVTVEGDQIIAVAPDRDASIRYTVDGSEPTITSKLYISPVLAFSPGDYKFAAFVPGMARSQIVTVTVMNVSVRADSCSQAPELQKETGELDINNMESTAEPGEPSHAGYSAQRSVWGAFTPPADGDYTFTFAAVGAANARSADCGSATVRVAVYTGSDIPSLKSVVSRAGTGSAMVSFHAKGGTTYRLAMDSSVGGDYVLSWRPGYTDSFAFADDYQIASGAGERLEAPLESTAAWQVISCPSWITPESRTGSPDETMLLTVAANTTGSMRSGLVTVTSGNAGTFSFEVRQTSLTWVKTKAAAFAAAKGGKRILLVYGQNWCGYTRSLITSSCESSMVRTTLRDEYVLWYETGYDGSRYLHAYGFPTFGVIDPAAPDTVIGRHEGWLSASDFRQYLTDIKGIPALRAVGETTGIRLEWTPVQGASSYTLWRGASADSLSVLASGLTARTYFDTSVSIDRGYYYAVSVTSGGVEAKPADPIVAYRQLPAPQNFRVSTVRAGYVRFSFTPISTEPVYYLLARRYLDETEPQYIQCTSSSNLSSNPGASDWEYAAGRPAEYWIVAARSYEWDSSMMSFEPINAGLASSKVVHQHGLTVYLHANDGTDRRNEHAYDADVVVSSLPVPIREGYRFDGWSTKRDGPVDVTFPLTLTHGLELYARWSPYVCRTELLAPEVIWRPERLICISCATNTPDRVVVTNEVVWRVVSGTGAVVSPDGLLTPLTTGGCVTVEARGETFGESFAVQQEISVIAEREVTGLVVAGPDMVDVYDDDCARYAAFLTCTDDRVYRVPAEWSVSNDVSGVSFALNPIGETLVSSSEMRTRVGVRASYLSYGASMDVDVLGASAVVDSWIADVNTVWPGSSATVRILAAHYVRHGAIEPVTGDLSKLDVGLSYIYTVSPSNIYSNFRSKCGPTISIPTEGLSECNRLYFSIGIAEPKTAAIVSTAYGYLNYTPQTPTLTPVKLYDPDGGLLATVRCAVGLSYQCAVPVVSDRVFQLEWKHRDEYVNASTTCGAHVSELRATRYRSWCYLRGYANDGSNRSFVLYPNLEETVSLANRAFTRSGYDFVGWSSSPDGPVRYADGADVMPPPEIDRYGYFDLYAVWRPKNGYLINYHGRTDEEAACRACQGGVQTPIPEPIAAFGWNPRGMRCIGWASSAANAAAGKIWKTPGAIVSQPIPNGSTLDVYAVWSAAPGFYHLRFDPNNNASDGLDRVYAYGLETRLPSASEFGWRNGVRTFLGWATSAANAEAGKVWKPAASIITRPTASGTSLRLYAVWDVPSYKIRFIRNDGAGTLATNEFACGVSAALPTVVKLGFARRGYAFGGWATTTANARNGIAWRQDGATVKDATTAGTTLDVYAIWRLKSDYYEIRLEKNDGTGKWRALGYEYGKATALPSIDAGLGWARAGYTFKGWATSATGAVWKGDKATVATAAAKGKTLVIYAIWEKEVPSYKIRFIRNDGAGTLATNTFACGVSTSLPTVVKLNFARRGYDFGGWATTTANARNGVAWKQDGAVVKDATTAGKMLDIYAIWRLKSDYYEIRFEKNDGTGKWRALGYEYGKATALPSIDTGLGWARAGYTFKGWATSATGAVWKGDKATVATAAAKGKTLVIYAIWAKSAVKSAAVSPSAAAIRSAASAKASTNVGATENSETTSDCFAGELATGDGTYLLWLDPDPVTGVLLVEPEEGEVVCEPVTLGDWGQALKAATEDGRIYWLAR